MTCSKCGETLEIGSWPFCNGGHGKPSYSFIGDEIDMTTPHIDGVPRRFTSRAELNRTLKEKGLVNLVEHVGERGSDKSPHTVRWV